MKTVYLSGGIKDFTEEDKHDWRERAKKLLKTNWIDPTRFSYDGRHPEHVVETDKRDIMASDYLLVYFIRPSVGTSMEIMYAHFHDIPVYTVNEFGYDLSPWLLYHSDKMFPTLEEAIEAINGEK
jgi:hypothetical protein